MDGIDTGRFVESLFLLERFYEPAPGEEKKGIGHEIEHLVGAVHRANSILDRVNDNIESYSLTGEKLDRDVVTATAAFHDIGNAFGRSSHNQFSRGAVQGYLNVHDVVSVPDRYIGDRLSVLNALDGGSKASELLGNEDFPARSSLLRACAVCAQFEIRFNDYGVSVSKTTDPREFATVIKEFAPKVFGGEIDDKSAVSIAEKVIERAEDDGEGTVFSYIDGLEEITEAFHDAVGNNPETIRTVAEGVQDHNIDKDDKGDRYIARSLCGAVVYDADKDDVLNTFLLRTYAYAVNKWVEKDPENFALKKTDENGNVVRDEDGNPEYIRDENGDLIPDSEACMDHVLDQLNERFATCDTDGCINVVKYQINARDGDTDNIRIKSTKLEVTDREHATTVVVNGEKVPMTADLVRDEKGNIDKHPVAVCGNPVDSGKDMSGKDVVRIYIRETGAEGSDRGSMLDTICKNVTGEDSDRIASLRSQALDAAKTLGDPVWQEKHPDEVKSVKDKIVTLFESSPSIYDAIADVETDYRKEKLGEDDPRVVFTWKDTISVYVDRGTEERTAEGAVDTEDGHDADSVSDEDEEELQDIEDMTEEAFDDFEISIDDFLGDAPEEDVERSEEDGPEQNVEKYETDEYVSDDAREEGVSADDKDRSEAEEPESGSGFERFDLCYGKE